MNNQRTSYTNTNSHLYIGSNQYRYGNPCGVYQTPQGYYVDDADVEEFDEQFPYKEKLKLPGQIIG